MSLPLLILIAAFPAFGATLEEAFQSALGKNETLGQSQQQVEQSDARLSQLRGGVLPNLSLNALQVMQPLPADPNARQFSPQHQTTVSVGLQQPLFRGLREFAGLRGRKNERAAYQAAYDHAAATLFLEVATAYLNVLKLEQDQKNLEEQGTIYEQRVGELGGRVKRGESNSNELLTAQSTEASVAAELRLVQADVLGAREKLALLTGLPPETPVADPNVLAGGKTSLQPRESYLARVEERPDVKSAIERFRASEENVSVAWGAHFPSLDLTANYYFKRPGFLADLKWDVGLRLTVPLFEGGATQAKVREAVSMKAERELEVARLRRQAQQQIRSSYDRVVARLDHVEKIQKSASIAQKNSVLMRRDYRRGLSRNIDVQLALTDYQAAQRSYDKARFDSQVEFFQLQNAAALTPELKTTSQP